MPVPIEKEIKSLSDIDKMIDAASRRHAMWAQMYVKKYMEVIYNGDEHKADSTDTNNKETETKDDEKSKT